MTTVPHQPSLHRRPEELGRRVTGAVFEVGLKAYGAAAAVSVALSDAETVGGKGRDALNAVPALVDRYQQAKYVVDHREQIQATLDDVSHRAPDAAELQQAVGETSRTLSEITTTYDEVNAALRTLTSIRPNNVLETVPRAKDHVDRAWAARPDLDSIRDLADAAQAVTPFLQRLRALDPQLQRIYADLLSILDNCGARASSAAGTRGTWSLPSARISTPSPAGASRTTSWPTRTAHSTPRPSSSSSSTSSVAERSAVASAPEPCQERRDKAGGSGSECTTVRAETARVRTT